MGNSISKKKRKHIMRSIKSQSKLEDEVSKELWRRGARFRKNVKDLYGKPDIAIKKYKVVIFIDSCFWHVCPIHGHYPKSNKQYWDKKLDRNQKRDIKVTEYYKENGWDIRRFWEHEIKEDFDGVVSEAISIIEKNK